MLLTTGPGPPPHPHRWGRPQRAHSPSLFCGEPLWLFTREGNCWLQVLNILFEEEVVAGSPEGLACLRPHLWHWGGCFRHVCQRVSVLSYLLARLRTAR